MNLTVLTVKQLNTYVKSLLEGDVNLAFVCVSGEMSNMKIYNSGHLYFSLRDKDSIIKCVMFSSNVQRLGFLPSDGMRVIVKGKVTLYEKDGSYQLICENIIEDGIGDVSLQFKILKDKLNNEGLFDEKFKKTIPSIPKKIGVVTSKDGAALHDIINVISRRYPLCELVLFPTIVQGTDAPQSIIKALKLADSANCDIIIVGRGGGSKEDLEAFNDENVARTVFALNTPSISAVGHETDFTIIDYVSDLRAPTPSAAAEIAVSDISEVVNLLDAYQNNILFLINKYLDEHNKHVQNIANKDIFANPQKLYGSFEDKVNLNEKLLINAFNKFIDDKDGALNLSAARLNDLNPLNVLSRGYSLVYNNDKLVKSYEDLNNHDTLKIITANDSVEVEISNIKKVN